MLLTPRLCVRNRDTHTLRTVAGGPVGQSVRVIARADCAFRRTRLVGEGKTAIKAAQMRARKEALPTEDGILIRPDRGADIQTITAAPMAGVWSFEKHPDHKGRYLPESLARVPHDNGARVVSGLSGYDGQIWVDKNLVASRWWASVPTDQSWDQFVRSAQETLGPLALPKPAPVEVPWRTDIAPIAFDTDQISYWLSPAKLGAAVATALLCGGLYLGGQYTRERLAMNTAEKQLASLSSETALILSQRRRALANMRGLARYDTIGSQNAVMAGMDALLSVLGTTDLALERYSLRQNKVDMRLSGETEISVPDVVSLLEAHPALTDVSVSIDVGGAVQIRATLSDGADEATL